FILAVQLFITLIESKLTTLAGFVLIPFGLFSKTAFLAERVLGNVVSSGVKVLVLAVIVGIGSTLFSQFTAGSGGAQPSIEDAMALVLASLALLGLGIFGPGIANGIVSGGPQLGAGAAIGTRAAAGGLAVAGGALATGGASALAGAAGAAARGSAALAGGAVSAYRAGGLSGVTVAGASAAASPLRRASERLATSFEAGGRAAAGGAEAGATSAPTDAPPAWARRMRRSQAASHGASAATHAIRSGDHGGGGSSIDLSEGGR
ncbi:MAG: P-type conjugative transfer protein TrbL, partial [Reyranella sp.]